MRVFFKYIIGACARLFVFSITFISAHYLNLFYLFYFIPEDAKIVTDLLSLNNIQQVVFISLISTFLAPVAILIIAILYIFFAYNGRVIGCVHSMLLAFSASVVSTAAVHFIDRETTPSLDLIFTQERFYVIGLTFFSVFLLFLVLNWFLPTSREFFQVRKKMTVEPTSYTKDNNSNQRIEPTF